MLPIQIQLQTDGPFATIEHLQRQGTPLQVAALYEALLLDLYWKAHDLPSLITLSRAGILYCLTQSLNAPSPDDAAKLRSSAKHLAYNAGSFTWPGWEEPNINPTPADLAYGMDCAQLNLRLALELHRPPKGVSNAHWLLGAHALAAKQFPLAEKHFALAQQILTPTDAATADLHSLSTGFHALAQLCHSLTNASAQDTYDKTITHFSSRNDEDAKSYLTQLRASHRLFSPQISQAERKSL